MRIERDCAAIGGLGFAEAREFAKRHAELVVETGIVRLPAQRALERGHGAGVLAFHRERIAERGQRRRMVGIDIEDPVEQRGAVGGAVGDEGGNGGQVQRRHMIRLNLEHLRAEHVRLIRPPGRKMLCRLQHNPIHSHVAHDTAHPFGVRDAS